MLAMRAVGSGRFSAFAERKIGSNDEMRRRSRLSIPLAFEDAGFAQVFGNDALPSGSDTRQARSHTAFAALAADINTDEDAGTLQKSYICLRNEFRSGSPNKP
jgi:hypothetical protein